MTASRLFSKGYQPSGPDRLVDRSGIDAVLAECARQHQDAMETVSGASEAADRLAETIERTGQLLLLGMGASHYVNQIAAARFRAAGVAAVAMPASEALYTGLPSLDRPVVLVSQSGGSAEVIKWLNGQDSLTDVFGLTLDTAGTLGKRVPSVIAAGGPEKAFAATRSFALTMALYAVILARMNGAGADLLPTEEPPVHAQVEAGIAALERVKAFAASGRGSFDGMAGMAALGIMELTRLPALALEGGQLRHGPVEMLGPETGVILFRPAGPSAGAWESIAGFCSAAGAPLVVFDASGEPPLEDAVTLDFPPGDGLASLYAMAPTQQALTIALASRFAHNAGQPLYCGKVTTSE